MRRIILFLQLLLGVEMIYAQTETEILNYSRLSYAGSARAAAMGGAFGALGGDISSWNLNPAAVGVFRKSSVTYTSVLNFSGNESGELTARKTSYLIGTVLTANGYDVIKAYTGTAACQMLDAYCPDLIILDLGLPDMDGVDIIRRIRGWSVVPIIVVSARTRERDKIEALDLGADDYLTKPFGGGELLARIRTALRHTRTQAADPGLARTGIYRCGRLRVDFDSHLVWLGEENVHLTQSEYRIVALLTQYAGKVLTYDFIIREIWGPNAVGDTQNLRANMAKIRRKLEKNPAKPQYIFTEVGVGYRMAEGD